MVLVTDSHIVYCKRNQKKHPPFKVNFLGFTFKPRMVKGYYGNFHLGFTPSISRKSQKRISQSLFKMKLHRMVHLRQSDLAGIKANKVRGWIHYYGKVRMSELNYVFRFLNMRLANEYATNIGDLGENIGFMHTNGYRKLPSSTLTYLCIGNMVLRLRLFKKSRMMGDYHVRFCERFRGEIPLYLLTLFKNH